MNILILGNKDLATNYALNMLLPQLREQHQVHLWLSAQVGKQSERPRQLQLLKFFEQDLFNSILSPALAGRSTASFQTFENFTTWLSSEIKQVSQINSAESISAVHELAPDLIISIRFGGILKDEIIQIPKQGVVNLHSGILPKYRGVMATFWAMKNGDSQIGTTLHTIDDGSIDTGEIIKISKHAVVPAKCYLTHVLSLYRQGVVDIIVAVDCLAKGQKLTTLPQESSDSYFTFPTLQDCHDFAAKGFEMVNEQDYLAFMREHYL
ncbi:formyl transferase [Colwellia sp. MEBiC06753]